MNKWYNIKLNSGESFIGSPYLLPSGKNYDFWFVNNDCRLETRRIPVVDVNTMVEVVLNASK